MTTKNLSNRLLLSGFWRFPVPQARRYGKLSLSTRRKGVERKILVLSDVVQNLHTKEINNNLLLPTFITHGSLHGHTKLTFSTFSDIPDSTDTANEDFILYESNAGEKLKSRLSSNLYSQSIEGSPLEKKFQFTAPSSIKSEEKYPIYEIKQEQLSGEQNGVVLPFTKPLLQKMENKKSTRGKSKPKICITPSTKKKKEKKDKNLLNHFLDSILAKKKQIPETIYKNYVLNDRVKHDDLEILLRKQYKSKSNNMVEIDNLDHQVSYFVNSTISINKVSHIRTKLQQYYQYKCDLEELRDSIGNAYRINSKVFHVKPEVQDIDEKGNLCTSIYRSYEEIQKPIVPMKESIRRYKELTLSLRTLQLLIELPFTKFVNGQSEILYPDHNMRDLTVENFEEILRQQTFLFWYDSYHSSNKTHQLTNESANEIDNSNSENKSKENERSLSTSLEEESVLNSNNSNNVMKKKEMSKYALQQASLEELVNKIINFRLNLFPQGKTQENEGTPNLSKETHQANYLDNRLDKDRDLVASVILAMLVRGDKGINRHKSKEPLKEINDIVNTLYNRTKLKEENKEKSTESVCKEDVQISAKDLKNLQGFGGKKNFDLVYGFLSTLNLVPASITANETSSETHASQNPNILQGAINPWFYTVVTEFAADIFLARCRYNRDLNQLPKGGAVLTGKENLMNYETDLYGLFYGPRRKAFPSALSLFIQENKEKIQDILKEIPLSKEDEFFSSSYISQGVELWRKLTETEKQRYVLRSAAIRRNTTLKDSDLGEGAINISSESTLKIEGIELAQESSSISLDKEDHEVQNEKLLNNSSSDSLLQKRMDKEEMADHVNDYIEDHSKEVTFFDNYDTFSSTIKEANNRALLRSAGYLPDHIPRFENLFYKSATDLDRRFHQAPFIFLDNLPQRLDEKQLLEILNKGSKNQDYAGEFKNAVIKRPPIGYQYSTKDHNGLEHTDIFAIVEVDNPCTFRRLLSDDLRVFGMCIKRRMTKVFLPTIQYLEHLGIIQKREADGMENRYENSSQQNNVDRQLEYSDDLFEENDEIDYFEEDFGDGTDDQVRSILTKLLSENKESFTPNKRLYSKEGEKKEEEGFFLEESYVNFDDDQNREDEHCFTASDSEAEYSETVHQDSESFNPNSPYYYSPLTDRTRLSSKGGYVDGNKTREAQEKFDHHGKWMDS